MDRLAEKVICALREQWNSTVQYSKEAEGKSMSNPGSWRNIVCLWRWKKFQCACVWVWGRVAWYYKGRLGQDSMEPSKPCKGIGLSWGHWGFLKGFKGRAKECSNDHTIALILHASKVMLKVLQARLQRYVNRELPDVQAGSRKGRGTRYQIANIRCIIKKAREFQKNIYFCFIDYAKTFDCVDYNKLWKILKEMGIPDHLTCLLRNLYAGQEATDLDVEKQTGSK